jgi:hypothetical protein
VEELGMIKKELEKYEETYSHSGDNDEIDSHVLADIAYQLTRIADALEETNRHADFQESVNLYKGGSPK